MPSIRLQEWLSFSSREAGAMTQVKTYTLDGVPCGLTCVSASSLR